MNVLLIGSGGREHALAWKLAASPMLTRLYAAPGNPGIAKMAELVALDIADHAAVASFCREKSIDLVVVGPEGPLVAGLGDRFAAGRLQGLWAFRGGSPARGLQRLHQGSLRPLRHSDGAYGRFDNASEAKAYVASHGAPIVVKADGLAAGKGVTVAMTEAEALCSHRRLL